MEAYHYGSLSIWQHRAIKMLNANDASRESKLQGLVKTKNCFHQKLNLNVFNIIL